MLCAALLRCSLVVTAVTLLWSILRYVTKMMTANS